MVEVIWNDTLATEAESRFACSSIESEAVEGQWTTCIAQCPRCSARLTLMAEPERKRQMLQCPYCGHVFTGCFA
jgi:DNA-directed RNA polymerase subunit RPC12/RpoP